jgi:PKD repeat protein
MRVRGKLLCWTLGALIAFAFACAGVASATVYCVNEPACVGAGGTEEGTNGNAVQKAFEAAEAHQNSGGADEVVIGAGSYSRGEAYSYGGAEPAVIRGAGAGATTLGRTAVDNSTVMLLASAGSTLEGLTVEAPAAHDVLGLGLSAGTVEGVTVAAEKAGESSTGLKLSGGEFKVGSVTMSSATSSATTDVEASGGGVLTNSSLSGGEYGVQAVGFPLVRGCRIAATFYGLLSYSSSPIVEDTLFDLGGHDAYGLYLEANSATAKGLFDQLTIVNGGPNSRGLFIGAENKHTASAKLDNSIISGIDVPLTVTASEAGSSSSVTATYSSYESLKDTVGSLGTVFDEHHVEGSPGFVDPVPGSAGTGDWRLAPTSPMIDAGAPGELAPGEYPLDAAGQPRIVNARRDVGAYEYQRRSPLASVSASSASASAGTAITFDGSASGVQEAGDTIASYAWSFGDGGSATGAQVAHAFAAPGTYTVTLTVTDALGLTAQASTPVTVIAVSPAVPPAAKSRPQLLVPGVLGSGLSSLRISPSTFRAASSGASIVHGKRGGALVSYSLKKAAKVSFTLEHVVRGVKHGKVCVRRRRGLSGKSCALRLLVPGIFTQTGKVGGNSFRFSGRLGGKKLGPGSYLLVARAVGLAVRASFQISS